MVVSLTLQHAFREPTKALGQLSAYYRVVGVEGSAPVRPPILQTAPSFVVNSDMVDLSLPLTQRNQMLGSIPVVRTCEARTGEKQLII